MMHRSQKLYGILQWLKTSDLVVLVAGVLGTLSIFRGLRESDVVNFWVICGSVILIICLWQIQARLPDRDWM